MMRGMNHHNKNLSVSNPSLNEIDDIKTSSDGLPRKNMILEGISNATSVYLTVNGDVVYKKTEAKDRGINLIILNQYNGDVMDSQIFDTYVPYMELYIETYMKKVRDDVISVFLMHDDAQLNLQEVTKKTLERFGSTKIRELKFRSKWAFVSKGKIAVFEEMSEPKEYYLHGKEIKFKITIPLEDKRSCGSGNSSLEEKRTLFCFRYLGYETLCNCSNPSPIQFSSPYLENNRMATVPITVIASNRPHYLYLMLSKLLSVPGVSRDLVTVYIDGFHDQVIALVDLLRLKYVEHASVGKGPVRIHQNYKFALYDTFSKYPKAGYMLILEEDLLVADDIIDYFSQLLPVLESDQSVYCISAWNDNSFNHTTHDPSLVYRVQTMPGLGWVLKRELFIKELGPRWPDEKQMGDWDMWMRLPQIRKGRECLIPDISRTFHFGKIGTHVNDFGNGVNAYTTVLNKKTGNKFDISKLTKNEYEKHVHQLLKNAIVLDHSRNPCNVSLFIPNTKGSTYVMYIKWGYKGDTETWLNLAGCLNLFHVDVRGFHRIMWRFWLKGNHVFVVGSTSPYAVHKPENVTPIFMSNSMTGRKFFDMKKYQGYNI